VILTITQDDLRIMSKLLVEVYGPSQVIEEGVQEVELEKILLYLATNEAMRAGELNYRSVKASQHALMVKHIYNTLVNPIVFREKRDQFIEAFNQVKRFVSHPRGDKPYERYGIPVVRTPTMVVLKKEIQRSLRSVKRLFANVKKLESHFTEEVLSREEEVPKMVFVSRSLDLDETMEIEGEEEQEQEQENENDIQEQVDLPSEEPYSKVLVRWSAHREKLFNGTLLDQPTRFWGSLLDDSSELSASFESRKHLILSDRMRPEDIAELNPVIPLKDVLKAVDLQHYDYLFDPRIHGSLNLFPIFQSTKESKQLFTPFGYYQGSTEFILISLNQDHRVQSLVLITRDEALFVLGEWLLEDRDEMYHGFNPSYLLLYQFDNGFIRESANFVKNSKISDDGGVDEMKGDESSTESLDDLDQVFADDQNRSDFLKLLVQAKFISGATRFTQEQRAALELWRRESKGSDDLFDFFSSKILQFKDFTQKNFKESILYEMLHRKSDAFHASRSG
jgi:hypothetical protein